MSNTPHRPRISQIQRFDPNRRRFNPKTPRGQRRKPSGNYPTPIIIAAVVLAIAATFRVPFVAQQLAPVLTGRETVSATVRQVIDGDSIVVGRTEIRLGDFDAPEYNERGGQSAKVALRSIALGRRVVCIPCEGARVPGRCTSYDRLIATCRLDGTRLGDLMRSRGIQEGGR